MFEQHHSQREEWATLVGRLMLAFGDMENATLLALERFSSESIMRTASSLLLAKRIDLLIEIIESKTFISDAARLNFQQSLAAVKKLSEIRNLIAHNPLVLESYPPNETGEFFWQGVIMSVRNESKRINIQNMRGFVEKAEQCRTRLFDAYGQMSLELLQRLPKTRKKKVTEGQPRL